MSAVGPVRKTKTGRDDWETPWPLFRALDREFHFTLDAAADEQNRKCFLWLAGPHVEGNGCTCGLCADWLDHVAFVNPPYGRGLQTWIEKCADAAERGATVGALLPANTDTRWFRWVVETCNELRLLYGRVNFDGSTSGNTGGSMVAIWRPERPRQGGPRWCLWDWRKVAQ